MPTGLNVLLVPYLFFKDFAKSSGVLTQADVANALTTTGHNVTVLLPEKDVGGWVYEPETYFGTHPRMSYFPVPMVRNQMLWAGVMPEGMAKVLTPTKSPLMYDVVFNGNPCTSLAWSRLLCEVGFAGDLRIPIVNYYDIATIPEEVYKRGGVSTLIAKEIQMLELSCGCEHQMVFMNRYDYEYRKRQVTQFFSPAMARRFIENLNFVDKPILPIKTVNRNLPRDGIFRIFLGRGVGNSSEEGNRSGDVHLALFKAVEGLHSLGVRAKIVICTASDLDNDWFKGLLALVGGKVEIHHKATRSKVMEVMSTCHVGVDLRGYDGLYLAAIEQMCSGLPVIVGSTDWIRGTADSPWKVSMPVKYKDLLTVLLSLLRGYEDVANKAFEHGLERSRCHSYDLVGETLGTVLARDVELLASVSKYKSYSEVFERGLYEGSFEEVEKKLLSLTRVGSWGRMPRAWVMKMIRSHGFKLEGVSNGGLPKYEVVRV